ncbi:hypothetical protein [Nafulsella turpanensis]|uniref:hypothetical protein n=1 Tax=Nafulsella turpanensis TaxID=1265690 RepID=UPI001F45A55D|nr:hypothetical protein [Nafulsella turpanensis]
MRKWFFPSLAVPLLVIRDPIALWLIYKAWQRGLLPSTPYLGGMVLIGIIGTYMAVLLGHGNIPVAIFGARILLIQIPFLFVVGSLFSRKDVIRMGKITLLISIPMAALIALQFYSPQSAWVNRGLGGDMEGAGFGGALGFFRPPATFSFTNGTTLFFSFAACFILYFWLQPAGSNRFLLIAATTALLIAVPLSISRGLFFQVGVSLVFALIAISRKPKYIGRMLLAGVGGIVLLISVSQMGFFQTATEAFTARFETATDYQQGGVSGVLIDRFLGGLVSALFESTEQPFFGYGLGMGTNVGSMLLAGKRTFMVAEEEWARTVGELGPFLGLAVIFLRLGLIAKIAWACYQKLVKGDLLPWMLLSFGILLVSQGGWAQPTSLGFCVLTGGLLIASLRNSD